MPGFTGIKPAVGDVVRDSAGAVQSNLPWAETAREVLVFRSNRTTGLDVRVAIDSERYTVP